MIESMLAASGSPIAVQRGLRFIGRGLLRFPFLAFCGILALGGILALRLLLVFGGVLVFGGHRWTGSPVGLILGSAARGPNGRKGKQYDSQRNPSRCIVA